MTEKKVSELTNRTYDEIAVGDQATYSKRLSEREIILFAAASGDLNPVHLDADYAATTQFRAPIAHGIWSASLISAAIGMCLPGPGSIYLGQTLSFTRPVRIGDEVTIQLEVIEKRDQRQTVMIACRGINQEGKKVIEGVAEVMAPKQKLSITLPKLPDIVIG